MKFFAQTSCILKDVLINGVELGSKTGNEMMTLNKVRGGGKDVMM